LADLVLRISNGIKFPVKFNDDRVSVDMLRLALVYRLIEGGVELEGLEEKPVRVVVLKHLILLFGLNDQLAAEVESQLIQSNRIVSVNGQLCLLLIIIGSEAGVAQKVVLTYA
jgi:hypothetical protein